MTVFVGFDRVIHFNKHFVYWKDKGKVYRARTCKGVNGRMFPVKMKTKEEVKACRQETGDGKTLYESLKNAGIPVYKYVTGKGKTLV